MNVDSYSAPELIFRFINCMKGSHLNDLYSASYLLLYRGN